MAAFDTFLFDLDGTLADTVDDLATAVNLLRGELGLEPMTVAEIKERVGDGARLLMKRSLPQELFREQLLERFLILYRDYQCEKTRLFPGLGAFLEGHRRDKLAVITNKPLHLSRLLLEDLGIIHYFSLLFGAESCPTRKPDPGPILEALRQLGSDPERAVMIGDHHTDLKAGNGAGIKTCFCAWGFGHDGGERYDFLARTPADLLRLFPPTQPIR
ncbi:MAG: HAD-IA family hydrolase [Deltaproteobacteria bacterium]|nr:HAD-IA family hydrolase [Deltaproteobacteria bacterium]